MEFYHNQLKVRLLNEKDPGVYQRADWLVDNLGTKVHSYFWLDEYSGKDDFARYWKDEWVSGLTSWRKALKIPDSNVLIEGRCAKVMDHDDGNKAYIVWNPGSQFSICDCSWAEMGYLCEHIFKVIRVCRKKGSVMPSISLFQYNQALVEMLHCSPHDSLIRDHAISLAVSVQKQLNALADVESCQTTVDPIEKRTVGVASANQDRELISKSQSMNEDVLSHNEKDCVGEQDAPGAISNDLGSRLINQVVSENTIEEICCANADVDPPLICISPPGLVSVDEIVSSDCFSKNEETVLINSDHAISINPTCKHGACTGQNRLEVIRDKDCHQGLMEVEQLAINSPPSTIECLEQCDVTHQNGVWKNGAELTVHSSKADANSLSDEASLSMAVPNESNMVVSTAKIASGIKDDDLHSVNGSATNDSCSTDNVLPLDGNCMDATNDSNLCNDAKAVDKVMSSCSESLKSQPSMPSDSDNQQTVDVETQETESCKLPLSDEPSLTGCKLKRSAEDGDCDNICTKKGKKGNNHLDVVSGCNSIGAEGISCEIADDALASSRSESDKHQTEAGIASGHGC